MTRDEREGGEGGREGTGRGVRRRGITAAETGQPL